MNMQCRLKHSHVCCLRICQTSPICNIIHISILFSSSLQFSKIAHVEENRENLKGKRYFLEIDVVNITSKEKLRISNYVYKPSKDEPLCSPKDYRWDKSVKIYLLTPVRNQFKWIRYHLENINHIIRTVNDNNLHLIVMDFNSTDGNITELLKNSNINYTLINMDGPFNKVVALNKAASGIDDESIVFVLDLHLEIPLHLFDQVRKVSKINLTFNLTSM